MIRIGAVNIDTSHPLGFGEVMEKDDRARYVGVYNDSFRPDSEVEGFIRRFGLEKRCNTLEELAAMCDIGFIHGCDWDDHLRCAMPFIEQGKPVFIDKPLVGNLADCRRVEQLVKDGAVILGASSARYAYEVQQFLALPDGAAHKVGAVGIAAQGNDFPAQLPVHPQPLFPRQGIVAPVGIDLNAAAVFNQGPEDGLHLCFKAVKGQVEAPLFIEIPQRQRQMAQD